MRWIVIFLLCFASCSRHADDPIIVQKRLRTLQTRTFARASAKEVIKETLAVLQDEGFRIKNVSAEIGLLTAERDANIEKLSSKFWAYIFSGKKARWKKHSLIEITTNVTEEEGQTRMRINLFVRIFDNMGRMIDVHQILDEEVYQAFFDKVQKSIIAV